MNTFCTRHKHNFDKKQEYEVTQDVQICSGADRGGATAPKGGFAFVIAAVTDQRTADGQTATEVPKASVYQHSIFPPCNAELNERPGGTAKEIRINTSGQ